MALTACSSGGSTQPSSGAATTPSVDTAASAAAGIQVVKVQAGDGLTFAPASIPVKPGLVKLVFTVSGSQPQTFTSTALRVDSGMVKGGSSVTLDVVVPKAGKYPFFSAYHREQGMTGVLVATA